MTMLWQKPGAIAPDADVQSFLAGEDIRLDRHLLPFDIRATIAHVRGLRALDLLTAGESDDLVEALADLERTVADGTFVLDDRFEDGHSAIESHLTDRLGDTGRRVHLGRSRDDQVLVAQRLYVRHALDRVCAGTIEAARSCLERADEERDTPMPGYTHLQRAVPSTVGLWMAAFGEAWIDDAELLRLTIRWLDACPLGTAAGYGVNLPLPRDEVADDLGFDRIVINPMYAQNSRGKHELQALGACWQVLQDVRRLAWDISLFSTSEFGFVTLDATTSTGSSIMPGKRNPDLAELMRASVGTVTGAMAELQQVLSLPSGYHRDLQATKGPVIRALEQTNRTITLVPALLASVTFDRERMAAAIDGGMLATDRAVDLARDGVPFREAYRQVAAGTRAEASPAAIRRSLDARVSPGACADLRLDALRARLAAL